MLFLRDEINAAAHGIKAAVLGFVETDYT